MDPTVPGADLEKLTWQLFDAIGRASGQRYLHRAVKRANNQLAPIRRAKKGLIENSLEELIGLHCHWRKRNIGSLRSSLRAYHQRRRNIVPSIVDMLQEGNRNRS